MKVKLLFLGKLLVISLFLFMFIEWIEKGYQGILRLVCSFLLSCAQHAVILDYSSCRNTIPFLTLMLATPRIKLTRRITIILIGLAVFIVIDIASILAWKSFPNPQTTTIAHLFFSQIWRTGGQWILPLLFWFLAVYKDMGELFVADSRLKPAGQ